MLSLAFKSHHKNPPSMAGTDYVSFKSSDLLLCCSALTDLHKSASCFHGKSWGLGLGLILEGSMLDVDVDMKKLNCPSLSSSYRLLPACRNGRSVTSGT